MSRSDPGGRRHCTMPNPPGPCVASETGDWLRTVCPIRYNRSCEPSGTLEHHAGYDTVEGRSVRRGCLIVLLLMKAASASAQSERDLANVDLEDLLRIEVQRVFGASERLQPVTEAPSSVTIVTADEIARYGYRTLADILRSVRGFYVTNDRNYSYVGVRGFARPGDYNTRVLLLVNGHRVNDNVYDQAAIGADFGVDVAMFDRVEIIRGPASSLYGTSAFFAVVNVITRRGASLNGISVDLDAGTLGTGLARVAGGRQFANGVDLALSGTLERSDGDTRLYFPAFDSAGHQSRRGRTARWRADRRRLRRGSPPATSRSPGPLAAA